MNCQFVVFNHPFFAVTGDDGTYTISGLPPGTYTVSVWHEIEALRASEFVEYERVAQLKLSALRAVFEEFTASGGSPEFTEYAEAEGALVHDFAIYCALDVEMHRRNPDVWLWTDWPPEYRDPRSPAVAEFAKEHHQSVLFYKFLQWHIDRQLAAVQAYALEKGMRIGLYHDLALILEG